MSSKALLQHNICWIWRYYVNEIINFSLMFCGIGSIITINFSKTHPIINIDSLLKYMHHNVLFVYFNKNMSMAK